MDENETVPAAVEAALKQIEEKKYETELIDKGIDASYIKIYKKISHRFQR